jgi:hypothetical protein
LPDIDYRFHDKVVVVTNCGRICLGGKKINFDPRVLEPLDNRSAR